MDYKLLPLQDQLNLTQQKLQQAESAHFQFGMSLRVSEAILKGGIPELKESAVKEIKLFKARLQEHEITVSLLQTEADILQGMIDEENAKTEAEEEEEKQVESTETETGDPDALEA
jgi:hypothetical protein